MFTKARVLFLVVVIFSGYTFSASQLIFIVPSPEPNLCLEGQVDLKIKIDLDDGSVVKAKIVKRSKYKILNKESKNVALELKYQPVKVEDRDKYGYKTKYSYEVIGIDFVVDKEIYKNCE